MDVAIIGLRQSGKTTVFEAITAGHGQHGGGREHLGVVKVPDERLERLAALVQAKKVTFADIRLHDLPPLFERGAAPAGEAAEALARADALIHVVRAFHRDDVPHPQGGVDPDRDIQALDGELLLHDLGIVERRLEKLDMTVRSARPGEREAGEREQAALLRTREHLESKGPLRDSPLSGDEVKALANFGLLTLKPMLILLNIDEAEAGRGAEVERAFGDRHGAPGTAVAAMCARLESELTELSPEEAAEFRQELEAGDTPARRVLRSLQEVMGLVTFYTPVGQECRAWPVPAGTTALQAAGRIHTDMERGFIRAEVIAWEKLMEVGSLAEAKRQGILRVEGKQYAVQDGDVIHILFHT